MRTRTAITIASVAAVGCAVAVPTGAAFADGMGSHASHVANVRTSAVHTAASSVNGTISRSEVISRAQYWLKTQPPYSETHYAPDPEGKLYRQDCSGSVSMAWHLGSSLTTWQFNPHSSQFVGIDHQIAWSDLQPGDALVRDDSQYDHMALFVGWADKAHTQPIVIEQYDYGHSQTQRTWNASYAHAFTPIRYNKIAGGGGGGGGHTSPTTKIYKNVWKTASSYTSPTSMKTIGVLHAGSNYFYCQSKGSELNSSGYQNDWWLKTDDDSGHSNVWVNAIFVSGGSNNGQIPGIPAC